MTATFRTSTRVRVLIPGLLRSYTAGAHAVDLAIAAAGANAGATLADALEALDARYPGMRFRLVDEQARIRPHIKMFVNGDLARGLATGLPADSVLMIVGALSGG
jgi:sulfur-carrier protein